MQTHRFRSAVVFKKPIQQLLKAATLPEGGDVDVEPELAEPEGGGVVDDEPKHRHRAIWISDVHIGTRHAQVNALLDFLRDNESQYLHIVGDFIDGWELSRNWYWLDEYNVLIQKILRKSRKNVKVTFITGNHDEFLEQFVGTEFGRVKIVRDCIHTTADKKRILVLHGHQIDGMVQCSPWLEKLGSALYQWILDFNYYFNRVRRRFGFGYWSVAAYLKMKAKSAVKYVNDYEDAMIQMAQNRRAKGVICGHIHRAEMKPIGDMLYMNSGDWIESCTALVEDSKGRFRLLKFHDGAATEEEANDDVQTELTGINNDANIVCSAG